ncbi:hypothetical protein [Streptomyces sp. H39-C1]|uniref:hypothetical protein n=1 Tax=Streptomyces sp. H39-C1 TaxID=3004355 RepID=UPI0022AE6E92|nr:hypothetical protein [Streptomyces sp. H39-C1]MCZ4102938.1 hypothetical protein [Streptomyces sp. H39-C1]
MSPRFPDLKDLGLLSSEESGALRCLNRAHVELRGEWECAHALTRRLLAKADLEEGYTGQGPTPHHQLAARAASSAAVAYERTIGEITWRYASAATVLGITIWDRLTCGRPPLSTQTLEVLAAEEPTLGQLRGIFSGPYARLLAFRADEPWRSAGMEQVDLLGLLESASFNVTHTKTNGRYPEESEAADCRLTTASPPDVDAFWEDLLPPALHLAEAVPFAIAQRLTSGSSPRR